MNRLNVDKLRLGTGEKLTTDEARAIELAEIEGAARQSDKPRPPHRNGPLFRYIADEFMRRDGPRWKPTTRESNRSALWNHTLPFFGRRLVPTCWR